MIGWCYFKQNFYYFHYCNTTTAILLLLFIWRPACYVKGEYNLLTVNSIFPFISFFTTGHHLKDTFPESLKHDLTNTLKKLLTWPKMAAVYHIIVLCRQIVLFEFILETALSILLRLGDTTLSWPGLKSLLQILNFTSVLKEDTFKFEISRNVSHFY